MLSRFTPIIFGVLPTFFTARFLGPENFAEYNLIFVFVTLTTNIFIAPYGTYLNNNTVSFLEDGSLSANLLYFFKYNFIVYLLLSSVLYFYLDLSLISLNLLELFIISFGLFFLNTLLQTFLSVLNYLGENLVFNIFTASFVVLTLAASLFGIYAFELTVFNWIIGTILVQFLFLCLVIGYFQRKQYVIFSNFTIKNYDFSIILKIYKYASPLLLVNISIWFIYQSYKFYLPNLIGLSETGIFLAAYGLASITASIVERVSLLILWPTFFRKKESSESMKDSEFNEYLKFVLNCLIVIFMLLFLYGDLLISIVLGEAFSDAYLFVILGFIVESFRVVLNSLFLVFYLNKKTKLILYYHLFIAVVFFSLMLLLKESLDVFIIIVSLSVVLWISITHFLYKNKQYKVTLNLKFIMVACVVAGLFYLCSFMTNVFFDIAKYLSSSLLIVFLIARIYNYLAKILIPKSAA